MAESDRREKILIIGNGFDLAHGLPTAYKDFMQFCNVVQTILLDKECTSISDAIENADIHSKIKAVIESELNNDIRTSCTQLLAELSGKPVVEPCDDCHARFFRRKQVSVQLPLAAKEQDNVPRLVLGVPEPAHVLDGYIAERILFSDSGRTRASR